MSKDIYKIVKNIADPLLALVGLIVLSPLMVVIALWLRFSSIGQVFFLHQRPGKDGKPFHLIKFKTMNDKRDSEGNLLPNQERITSLGKFLRQSSLDELPQLINVVKGDISLIGPRPLEMRYLPLYTPKQLRRHDVKPGISGWAQVNGRNAISWDEKFEYDVYYVDHLSPALDLKILWLTIKKVIRKEGINSIGQATAVPLDEYLKDKIDGV